jgi:hypothetical protein
MSVLVAAKPVKLNLVFSLSFENEEPGVFAPSAPPEGLCGMKGTFIITVTLDDHYDCSC